MLYKFITTEDEYYQGAVDLRIDLFFNQFENADELIDDPYEEESIHLVCINSDKKVVGTGRLTIEDDLATISQMAIHKDFQRQQIGKNILNALTKKCYEKHVDIMKLSARKTAIAFYRKYGFKTSGGLYPSKKTGIIHQNMSKSLEN